MKVGSLFAGVGGFDLGFQRAGMETAWAVEIDRQARAVFRHHFPNVEVYEDVRTLTGAEPISLLCGGFPCQDYSVAGKRSGLAGDRGALWWEFHRLASELRPTWIVGENVPGLLSSNGGRDFCTIIASLVQLGYGVTWAVLDSQYWDVAQRRSRLFIVGHSGGKPRPEILALSEGLFGHSAPSREEGERTADGLTVGANQTCGFPGDVVSYPITAREGKGPNSDCDSGNVVAFNWHSGGDCRQNPNPHGTDPLCAGHPPAIAFGSKDSGGDAEEDLSPTLRAGVHDGSHPNAGVPPAVIPIKSDAWSRDGVASYRAPGMGIGKPDDPSYTIQASTPEGVFASIPRRLTPTECERLQGFPDGWTDVDGMKDGPRYRMMGNAVTVNVLEWIGRRIMEADTILADRGTAP